jgi:trans-2-enoyl-CoA reductase
MGRLFEEQAVIDCLTNTAKYYEREDADEWTKGIHYGLLHGVDNILDDVKPVEAIPKDQYEARLKADMVTMLEEIKDEVKKLRIQKARENVFGRGFKIEDYDNIIQSKINKLRGE